MKSLILILCHLIYCFVFKYKLFKWNKVLYTWAVAYNLKLKKKRFNEVKTNLLHTFERHTFKLFFCLIAIQIEILIVTRNKLINSVSIRLDLILRPTLASSHNVSYILDNLQIRQTLLIFSTT